MRGLKNAAVVLACVLFVGCTSKEVPADTNTTQIKADADADTAALDGFQDAWEKAYNAGDAEAIVALYADQSTLSPPGSFARYNKSDMLVFFKNDIAANRGAIFEINPPNDRAIGGNTAWETGTWIAKDKSGGTLDSGKYLTAYRKIDNKWLISADIWNSDHTPAAGPADARKK